MIENDSICGKKVRVTEGTPAVDHKKKRYFFCSERCKKKFERELERARVRELARVGALLSKGRVRWGIA